MVIIDTKITAFSYRQVVTEKGGVHRTHNTPTVANEPCRLDSADLLHFTQNSNPSHIVTTDRPFPLHLTDRRMYRHNNVTDLKYPSSALPFIQVWDKKLSIAFTEYVQSRKHKLSWHQKTSQNNSFNVVMIFFPFLSNSSAATATTWLTTRRSGNSGVQPRSPSYRSFTLTMSIKILPFYLLQIHRSPQNYPHNPPLTT